MKTVDLSKRFTAFAAAALIAAGSFSGGISADAASKVISKTEAKSIALKDAGFSESDVSKVKVKLEGKTDKEYEVSFINSDFRYEYELKAATGKIKERDIDRVSLSDADASKDIGKTKAKTIALKKSGQKESAVTKLKVKAKKEKGYKFYKVEFEKGNYEYEYEIDAYIGKVLDEDVEVDD